MLNTTDNQTDYKSRRLSLLDQLNQYDFEELQRRIQRNKEIIIDTKKYLAHLQKLIETHNRLHK